ncbi:MAG: DUF58 domain-containing protein, partial [Acidimicrobiales bacterium]|nr:DUF58 domain-containing protein [Acidimicrobiales bacterium]
MLTRAGWAVAAGAITTLAVGRLLGAQELYILATMAGALLALALAWVRRPSTIPVLERHLRPDRPMAGSPARVEVLASGHGRRKTAAATVVDQVAGTVGARLLLGPIAPDAVHRVGYRLPTSQRGPLTVGPLDVEVSDPFGLARRRWRQGGPVQITVLPAVEALMGTPVGVGGDEQVAAGVAQRGAARTIADLATLRPYVVGDDLRRVHWPTSARVDDLVVRRDEERPQGQVSVLLDTGEWASAAAFEQAVSAAATLVHATAQADDRIRLQTTSGFDSGALEARHSEGALLETLAHLR